MPRLCPPCRFYSDDSAPAACPECGVPLQFTLLGRPGEDVPPMEGVPTGVTGRLGNNAPLADAEHAAPPTLLGGYVPSEYVVPALFLLAVGVIALVVTVITTR